MQNLFLWHVMIVSMKSLSLKQEADDVITRLSIHFSPFSLQLCIQPSRASSTFCEWIPSGRIDMDFTNNLSLIAGKLGADLRERTWKEKKKEDDPQGIYSPRLSLSFCRVLPFQTNPKPPLRSSPFHSPFQMY